MTWTLLTAGCRSQGTQKKQGSNSGLSFCQMLMVVVSVKAAAGYIFDHAHHTFGYVNTLHVVNALFEHQEASGSGIVRSLFISFCLC